MAEALSLEKTSTRYRICMIQEFAIQNLLATRNTANVLYEKLESWIDYAYKIENDALEEMAFIFQQYIEKEQKIQTEIRPTNYDIIVSESV